MYVARQTATEMSARIITSKRSTVAFRVFDKSGNVLTPVTTFNSFFAALVGTPCGAG